MNQYAWKKILQCLVEVYHKDSDLPSSIFCSIVVILTWRYILVSEVRFGLCGKKAVFLSQYVLGVIYFLSIMVIKAIDSELEINMYDH